MGERLSGFIYGTIVVLSVIIAGARAYPHGPGHIAGIVLVTSAVFWLAHVYAHAVGHSVAHDEHLSLAELRYIARQEFSVVEAALPPVAALALGHFGVISTHASVWLAFCLGVLVLVAQGITFARVERLRLLGTLVVVALNLCLGLVLIALKLVVSH
jgi:hypothetical protein